MQYPKDFPLYDHFVHALEYLGYNFDRGPTEEHTDKRVHRFNGEDGEWKVEIVVKATRKDGE